MVVVDLMGVIGAVYVSGTVVILSLLDSSTLLSSASMMMDLMVDSVMIFLLLEYILILFISL